MTNSWRMRGPRSPPPRAGKPPKRPPWRATHTRHRRTTAALPRAMHIASARLPLARRISAEWGACPLPRAGGGNRRGSVAPARAGRAACPYDVADLVCGATNRVRTFSSRSLRHRCAGFHVTAVSRARSHAGARSRRARRGRSRRWHARLPPSCSRQGSGEGRRAIPGMSPRGKQLDGHVLPPLCLAAPVGGPARAEPGFTRRTSDLMFFCLFFNML